MSTDWLPGGREAQLSMARNWIAVLQDPYTPPTVSKSYSIGRGLFAALCVCLALFLAACDNPTGNHYQMMLSGDEPSTFPVVVQGYAPVAPRTFTVTNEGSVPFRTISVVLSGSDAGSFDLDTSSLADIPVNGTGTFTVAPKLGLVAGTYTADGTVTANADRTGLSFLLSFTVAPSVVLSVSGTHAFNLVIPLYVTVTNTGTNPTGVLSVVLSGANTASFTLSAASIADIPAGGTATFTVSPNTGLSSGTYTATVTASGDNGITASFNVSFTVAPSLTGLADVAAYLSGAAGGATADDPVPLAVNLGAGDWPGLLSAIAAAGKYVALDISAGAVPGTGTEFDPGTANTGESKIVALVLPGAARSIKDASDSVAALFKFFTALKEVSGANVKTIDDYAFYNCNYLTTANFPAATDIGYYAFYNCNYLTTANFPAATDIGDYAFDNCNYLTTANFPAATDIGDYAFYNCRDLATADFPAATSIGDRAFEGCWTLTTASFPAAISIGDGAFAWCQSLTTADFPAVASIGDGAFHWCNALTTADFPAAISIGSTAFYNCTALTTANFPAAISIGGMVFYGCAALTTVDFPAATSIGYNAFRNTGTTALIITLPQAAPTVGGWDSSETYSKPVTVKTPADRTGYDDTWQANFKKAFGDNATITLNFAEL